jgi:hypothetical protein
MIDIRCAEEKVLGMGTSQGAMAAGYGGGGWRLESWRATETGLYLPI